LKGQRKAETLKRLAYQMVDINSQVDVKRSDAKSPSFHAEKITKPLYIIAGEKDRKVSILNVRDYALRLESMGKKVTFLSAPNEGHIYQKDTAIQAWYYLLEKALFDHIGGRMQKEIPPKVKQFLKKNTLLSPSI
jgi:dipeptidyl aminopeptidase/acylaminoacyl peptidase